MRRKGAKVQRRIGKGLSLTNKGQPLRKDADNPGGNATCRNRLHFNRKFYLGSRVASHKPTPLVCSTPLSLLR